jgi:hypothetical protein
MGWITVGAWLTAALTLVQWLGRWRLAGGVTWQRFWRECRRARSNMDGLLFWGAVLSLITWPFTFAFDLVPPTLIPLQIPLAAAAMLGTTGPVSFLVLGATAWHTTDICHVLGSHFPLLRAGAALDPMKLGVVADEWLGPSGNLWMSEASESWFRQIVRMIEDAPLTIFDGRSMTPHTCLELRHLLLSSQLPRVVVVGPVDHPDFAWFLRTFDGVPVVAPSLLPSVVGAAVASRAGLLEWYDRRRQAIRIAFGRYAQRRLEDPTAFQREIWLFGRRFSIEPTSVGLNGTSIDLTHNDDPAIHARQHEQGGGR